MRKYIKLLRVKHYLKNGLILIPIVFAGRLFILNDVLRSLIAFIVFSFAASAIYIINDINDIENDKNHPTKRSRPLASGEISKHTAYVVFSILIILVILLNYFLNKGNIVGWVILGFYILSNVLYSSGLKNIALLDVLILVLGYIIRLYYGATVIDVQISSWLYLTVMSIAFFLGLGKRRNEMLLQGTDTRKVLKDYNAKFLDKNMYLCLGMTFVFYSLWCESMSELLSSQYILFTIPLVIVICMKYSLDVEKNSDGDPIEVLLSDKVLILLVAFYAILIFGILYGSKMIY